MCIRDSSERVRINSAGAVMVGGTLQAGSNGGLNAEVTSSGNQTTAFALINQGTADGSGVIISHRGKDDAGNQQDYNYIRMVADDTGNGSEDGSIRFWTVGGGTLGERLRITSAGLVSIPISGSLQVGAAGSGETDTKVYVANTGGNAYIQLKGADSSGTVGLKFGRNSVANRAGIDWSASTDALSFRTGGTGERLRIDLNGNIGAGTGNTTIDEALCIERSGNVTVMAECNTSGSGANAAFRLKSADSSSDWYMPVSYTHLTLPTKRIV